MSCKTQFLMCTDDGTRHLVTFNGDGSVKSAYPIEGPAAFTPANVTADDLEVCGAGGADPSKLERILLADGRPTCRMLHTAGNGAISDFYSPDPTVFIVDYNDGPGSPASADTYLEQCDCWTVRRNDLTGDLSTERWCILIDPQGDPQWRQMDAT